MNDDLRPLELGHAEAHELIADLALEPGALARLVVMPSTEGDDADRALSALVFDDTAVPGRTDRERLAGLRAHVTACADCRRDVDAWLQTHARLGEATRGSGRDREATLAELAAEQPILAPPSLRERIQAEVARDPGAAVRADRTAGSARTDARSVQPGSSTPSISADPAGDSAQPVSSRPSTGSADPATTRARTRRAPVRLLDLRGPSRVWRAALPLVAVLALVVAGFGVVRDQQTRIDTARAEAAELGSLAASLDRLLADPGHRVVALAAPDGSARGTLAWSKHDIVVMTSALSRPPAGWEYRCWLERDGTRTRVGTMWFAGGLAYWSGSLDEWATISFDRGGRFGVSLEKTDGAGGSAPVLLGDLSG